MARTIEARFAMATDRRPKNALLYTAEELEQQRPNILSGVQQYNDGYFFEAHETLEDIWYRCPLPDRTFFQALIQLAAAFVHLVRHEYPGTVRLLGHALTKLEDFPLDYLSFDLAALRDEARSARDQLTALGPAHFEEWDRAGIPHVRLIEHSRRRRAPKAGSN